MTDLYRLPETDEELLAECRIDRFRSGGKGGQHQNRTESGVRLTHLPTGIVTSSRASRSQHRNKAEALARLRARITSMLEPTAERTATRVPEREKKARLEQKRRRSEVKKRRKPPAPDD